jgi:hypothetical protein
MPRHPIPAASAALGLAVLLATAACSSEPQCADLGPVSDYPEDTVTRSPCIDAFVVNDGGEFHVFLARSMHMEGEGLAWEPGGDEEVTDWSSPVPGEPLPLTGTFYNPMHGERFAVDGSVMDCPAAAPAVELPHRDAGRRAVDQGPRGLGRSRDHRALHVELVAAAFLTRTLSG